MRAAHEERWLSLDQTVENFARQSNASFDRNEFGFGVLHAGPIRIGDLQFDEWQTYCPDGPANRPLKTLHRDVVLGQGDTSYWTLKNYFRSFLGNGHGWERSDSNQWQYERDGVLVELTYWYNSDYAAESGYCSLRLTNLRDYPQYLVDNFSDHVDLAQVEVLTIPDARQGPTREFRRTSWVKRTSPTILSLLDRGECLIVWNDRKNLRIGFAYQQDALIVPCDECGEIQLLNVKPAKGGGYSQLRIREKGEKENGREFVAGQAAYNELATYRGAMERTLGFPVTFIDDLYDD